jgi:hypothetical protein
LSPVKISTITIIATMDQYIVYNSKYKVIICRQHGYCIPPNYISRHFRERHKSIPLATRQAIVDYSQSIVLNTPEAVSIPTESINPIERLNIIQGFQCFHEDCLELHTTENSMKQHCRDIHQWSSESANIWIQQSIQTFFVAKHCKYIQTYCVY